jgi:hypothetical protein
METVYFFEMLSTRRQSPEKHIRPIYGVPTVLINMETQMIIKQYISEHVSSNI